MSHYCGNMSSSESEGEELDDEDRSSSSDLSSGLDDEGNRGGKRKRENSSYFIESNELDENTNLPGNEPAMKQKRKINWQRSGDESSDGAIPRHQGMEDMKKLGNYSDKAGKMMMKMGYKPGSGLGRDAQGRVDIVPASKQRARRGLGLKIQALDKEVVVDWEDERPPSSNEAVDWMPEYRRLMPDADEMAGWETHGKRKETIDDETLFCEQDILTTMLSCKSVFDDLEGGEMRNARMRSNPYETIRGGIFLNRAAMKMANMDCCLDYMFTSPKGVSSNELLYFADICAGPGGFSEYVLWRRKWKTKGFGFTLKGGNDFKLEKFFASSPELFEPHYGVGGADGDGDIMKSENLEEFQNFVLDNTNEQGVHFVMADGGFSVEGRENIQEILTKQLLLCQFLCALSIIRTDGSFVCKTFDLFTEFSVGLVYLLRIAFKRISIFKPVTSRPANSERYVVCEGYRDSDRQIFAYLMEINDSINEFKSSNPGKDVKSVVPLDVLLDDTEFFNYVKSSNERIAAEQSKALAKLHAYAKDRNLVELRQTETRLECLKRWEIPDQVRVAPTRGDPGEKFKTLTGVNDPGQLVTECDGLTSSNLSQLDRVYDYRCYISGARSGLILCMGGAHIFFWNARFKKWSRLSQVNCRLPRDSVLEVEIVQELKGEGRGQHRVCSLHVVDALVLIGDNIMQRNFTERLQMASMFVQATNKSTCPQFNVVRVKDIFRLEEIEQLFNKISMKRIKGGGVVPRPCHVIANTEHCYPPTGLVFVKFTKDPWSLAFSKSQKRKYFYNTVTQQSTYECPNDFNASYQLCARNRVYWQWSEHVKIHPAQERHRADLVSSNQMVDFVQARIHH
ncbi:cap-specific mRNA (nucleoside-2'-O-)-methyltransferase 1-like isoform X2 [Clavelina lepadiformis]|uniref:cap-specific mRNA (nucleoside-2'-O-)-methyltransferase 1-like isoform X2 n=1 Tax=Clavelina lepadiformis TaxID=159417 RepID=UPI0040431657